uniref:hypothetical protein n=1 Tax=Bifidobacterium adolescentis TaxID=1680 RepID=UPI003BAB4A95
ASCFPIAILCLATENRTRDAGHARFNISTKNKTESAQEFGRYPISLMNGGFSCASAGISLMDGGVLK